MIADREAGERREQRDDSRRLWALVADEQRGQCAEEREIDRPGEHQKLTCPAHCITVAWMGPAMSCG